MLPHPPIQKTSLKSGIDVDDEGSQWKAWLTLTMAVGVGSHDLIGVTHTRSLLVWRFPKHTTSGDVVNYLKGRFAGTVEVETLETSGNYASFRVSTERNKIHLLRNVKIWPKYVLFD
jgi:hypothetical protein